MTSNPNKSEAKEKTLAQEVIESTRRRVASQIITLAEIEEPAVREKVEELILNFEDPDRIYSLINVSNAFFIKRDVCHNLDSVKEYIQAVSESLYYSLVQAIRSNMEYPRNVVSRLGKEIDFSPVLKKAFYENLMNFNIGSANDIDQDFGNDVDLRDTAKKAFVKSMEEFNLPQAFQICSSFSRSYSGKQTDFSSISEYDSLIENAFIHTLSSGDVRNVKMCIASFGKKSDGERLNFLEILDFVNIARNGFLCALNEGRPKDAKFIEDQFPKDSDGNPIDYRDESTFPIYLNLGAKEIILMYEQDRKAQHLDDLLYLIEEYGEGQNLNPMLKLFFVDVDEELYKYLDDQTVEAPTWKNTFDIQDEEYVDEKLLFRLHMLVLPFCEHFICQKVKQSMDLDPNEPFDSTKLSPEQLLQLNTLTKSLQKTISDKLTALMTPAVISAYTNKFVTSVNLLNISNL